MVKRYTLNTLFIFIFGSTCYTSCASQDHDAVYQSYSRDLVPFTINAPDDSFELPGRLREISGLSWAEGSLAAVEDEHGRIYLLDPLSGQIANEYTFKSSGDFEGIEYVDGRYYVMRSDGKLYVVMIRDGKVTETSDYETGLKKRNDVEGLGVYHASFIAACKGSAEVGDNDVKGRAAYLLDNDLEVMEDNPFTVKEKEIQTLVRERLPDVKINEFDPSGIAIDSRTGHIWIISADRILCVLDEEGRLLEVVLLDRKLFRQPEGICFGPEGELYISSEGDGKKALLHRFIRK